MARTPIYAAGGIVIRGHKRLLVAVVQRSKDERWVLPRGKLKRKEDPIAGARREVVEETGHPVEVHEFVGAITYRTSGRPKLVQFWRMQAAERPSRDLMADIIRVEWLPFKAAVRRLNFPLEKLFLAQVGRRVLQQHRKRVASAHKAQAEAQRKKQAEKQKKKKKTQKKRTERARRKAAAGKEQPKPRTPKKHASKRRHGKAAASAAAGKSRPRKAKAVALLPPAAAKPASVSLASRSASPLPVVRSTRPPQRANILRRMLGRLAQ